MIQCLSIPKNYAPLDFVKDTALKYDDINKKVCLIVPTERNLRILAGSGLKYVETYSIATFTNMLQKYNGVIMPDNLRPFYLKRAVERLSDIEKLTVFKSTDEEFYNNFIAFAQSASNIFAFYRELFAEMIDTSDLVKAGMYTDYEKQISTLNLLWQKYIEAVHADGYIDSWETYSKIELNEDILNMYDDYIFLIGGFLTKYEIERIKKIAETKNVILIFNYYGKKTHQHIKYEKLFGTDSLVDKEVKDFNSQNLQIFACSSSISQYEMIINQAVLFHEKNNIEYDKMAVIVPDDRYKSFFIKYDKYRMFDISSGDDITGRKFYSILENAVDIKNSLTDVVKIKQLLDFYSIDDILKENKETYYYLEELIEKERIYISFDEFKKLPFFSDILSDIINADEYMLLKDAVTVFKNTLLKLKDVLVFEDVEIIDTLNLMDELYLIYNNIHEKILFSECAYLILSEISKIPVEIAKKVIAVTGLLESRNMAYDVVFIPYMLEEAFPPKSAKDLFMNTEMRKQLTLPAYTDRENLMKNYLLQIMEQAKVTVISYPKANDDTRRSSFIEELVINNNIKLQKYSPDYIKLLKNIGQKYESYEDIIISKNDNTIEKIKSLTLSASSINTYLTCSLKFYFQYILKVTGSYEPAKHIDSRMIGSAIHNALNELHNRKIYPDNKNYTEELKKEYIKNISQYDLYKYNKADRFIANRILENIEKIAEEEKIRYNDGFKNIEREKKFITKFNNFKIAGFIDKVEYKKDNTIAITDYKYIDIDKIYKKIINDKKNIEDIPDVQLPLYALYFDIEHKKIPDEVNYFSIKEDFKYINGFPMERYEDFKDFLELLLNELIDKKQPFIMTETKSDCRNCDYKNICGR